MRFQSFVAVAVSAAALGVALHTPAVAQAVATSAKGTPPPLSAYGKLPDIEDAALSPDGSRLAVLTTRGDGVRAILLMSPALEVLRVFNVGDYKVRNIRWGSNENLIVQISSTERLYGFTAEKAEFTSTHIVR